jgi:hypothetical protein
LASPTVTDSHFLPLAVYLDLWPRTAINRALSLNGRSVACCDQTVATGQSVLLEMSLSELLQIENLRTSLPISSPQSSVIAVIMTAA